MDRLMDGWMDIGKGWMNKWMDRGTDGWMTEWMNERINGCMD